jgi:hypothetical protein
MRLPFFRAPKASYPALTVVQPAPVAVSIAAPVSAPRRGSSAAAQPRQSNTPVRGAYYEALNQNGDRAPLPLAALSLSNSVKNFLDGMQMDQLVLISRHLATNYPLARFCVRLKKNYSCPITVTSASPSPDWNTKADLWWASMLPLLDFTKRFHFNTMQANWCQELDTDGGVGIIVTAVKGFPQVQTVDRLLIKAPAGTAMAWGGVQQDEFGTVIGYWLETLKEMVPESQMLLLYEPNNSSEYCALPPMSLGSNDLRDSHEMRAFEKRRSKTVSSIPLAIRTQDGTVEAGQWDDTEDDQPDETSSTSEKVRARADFMGSDIPILADGEELVAPDLKFAAGADWMDFTGHLEGHFCYSIGFCPAFIQDAKLTGPNQRAVNDKTKKEIDARKATITRAVEWVRLRCIAWAIANNQLPPQVGWDKVSTQGPAELSIDQAQQVNDREATTMGLMTRREYYGKRSLNSDREFQRSLNEDEDIIVKCRKVATDEKGNFESALFDRLLTKYLPTRSVSFPISPVPPETNAP